jgi:hypothetical protein
MQAASQTAIMTAMGRETHHLMDPDPIFSGPYALTLAGKTQADVVELLSVTGEELRQ